MGDTGRAEPRIRPPPAGQITARSEPNPTATPPRSRGFNDLFERRSLPIRFRSEILIELVVDRLPDEPHAPVPHRELRSGRVQGSKSKLGAPVVGAITRIC